MRIEDILAALDKIRDFTEGMTFEKFRRSPMTMDAVFYNLTIIGEASRFVPDVIVERYPRIDWHRMRGMRNVLIHEYFGADLGIVWRTIQQDLAPLAGQLRELHDLEG